MFDFTLSYLDDHWMRGREEAKRQGAVLSYHRIVEQNSRESERNIVLLTEYKNQAAYEDSREKAIRTQRTTFRMSLAELDDVYEAMNARVFQDYSETGNVRVQPRASH